MGDMTNHYTEGVEFGEDASGTPLCEECRKYHHMSEECSHDL